MNDRILESSDTVSSQSMTVFFLSIIRWSLINMCMHHAWVSTEGENLSCLVLVLLIDCLQKLPSARLELGCTIVYIEVILLLYMHRPLLLLLLGLWSLDFTFMLYCNNCSCSSLCTILCLLRIVVLTLFWLLVRLLIISTDNLEPMHFKFRLLYFNVHWICLLSLR